MKILVIGGNGHYAGLITAHLAEKHDVTVFDLNDAPCAFACKQVVGNVTDSDALMSAAAGQEAIVSFFVGDAELSKVGMVNILTVAEQRGIEHVVYTSSGGLPFPFEKFGSPDALFPIRSFSDDFWREYFPISEDIAIFPGNETQGYFINKWLCEQLCRHFCARGKVNVTSIRPGLLMHDDMTNRPGGESDRHYEPMFMLMTGQVTMRDCAHLYDLALRNPPDGFEAYHGSNDTPYNNHITFYMMVF